MLRYTDMLESGFTGLGHEVVVLRPEPILGRLCKSASGVGKWLGYVDKFVIFPFILRRRVKAMPGAVTHICDHSNAMYVRWLKDVPHLVTCHDLLAVRSALGHFPQNKTGWTGRLLQRWILTSLLKAKRVVCDSEATRKDLTALGGDPAKISTMYIGLNHPYTPQDEPWIQNALTGLPEVAQLGPQGFIFHVGGSAWYKNRPGLMRIYFNYVRQGGRLPLIMAGAPLNQAEAEVLATRPAEATVMHVGSVTNDQLNALYCRAACLLFPSLYEGFGWPVLEAMACGCPVVCSDRSSLPEVGGGATMYLDPDNEGSASELIYNFVLIKKNTQTSHIEKGYWQASKFNHAHMLMSAIGIYRSL